MAFQEMVLRMMAFQEVVLCAAQRCTLYMEPFLGRRTAESEVATRTATYDASSQRVATTNLCGGSVLHVYDGLNGAGERIDRETPSDKLVIHSQFAHARSPP